jgi:hypothetical protein
VQSTQKSRRGRYCFICLFVCSVVVDDRRERQNIARAYGTGVSARRGHWFNIAIMLLLVLRHPTCASCVAWMCCRMSNSIKHVWASPDQSSRCGHWSIIPIMLFLVLRHPTCVSCVAWMCCRMSTSINKQVWSMSRSIIAASASILIEIMLLLVLRHPTSTTSISFIAWMCCRMSDSINKHVWTCPDLSFDRLRLYTFLRSLRSNFSPSRPLQLCLEAACETSFPRDIHAMQSTQKSRRGRYRFICLSVCPVVMDDRRERQNIARAYGTGVGARRGN